MKKFEKALIYFFPFLYVGFGWIGLGSALRCLGLIMSGCTERPILFMFYLVVGAIALVLMVPLVIYNVYLLLKDDENSPRRIFIELLLVIVLMALVIAFKPPLFEFIESFHLDLFI